MTDTALRYLETLRVIPRHPRKTTAGEVHQRLAAAGYSIDRRSVERDLHKLSTVFPITCDEGRRPAGWAWNAEAADLIAPGLGTVEALELELLARYLRPLLPANAWATLQPRLSAAQAELATFPGTPLARWRKRVAVIGDGPPLQLPDVSPDVVAVVHESLLHGRQLAADYRSVDAQQQRRYQIHPVALVYQGQIGYLVATLWEYSDLRLLALHRMSRAELHAAPARQPEDFDLDTYLREQSVLDRPGTRELRLTLRVSAWLARHLEERRLSDDQRITPEIDADASIVRATVRESERLIWWLRSHGNEVEVLKPLALRRRMAAEVAELAARYAEPHA